MHKAILLTLPDGVQVEVAAAYHPSPGTTNSAGLPNHAIEKLFPLLEAIPGCEAKLFAPWGANLG